MVLEQGKVTRMFAVCVYSARKLSCVFSLRDKGGGKFEREIVCKGDVVVRGEEERIWIRSAAPVLSGPREPPSGSGFRVNISPVDLFLPQGTETPGLPTFHFYFPGCKMPLAIRAGVFFLSVFTHKMCISRTKEAMIGPLVLANSFPSFVEAFSHYLYSLYRTLIPLWTRCAQ